MSSPDYGVCTLVMFSGFLSAMFSNMEHKKWYVVRKLVAVTVGNRQYVLFEESGCVSLIRFYRYHITICQIGKCGSEVPKQNIKGQLLYGRTKEKLIAVKNKDSNLGQSWTKQKEERVADGI